MQLLSTPFRMIMIAVVASLPAHLCCCWAKGDQNMQAIEKQQTRHSCCDEPISQPSKPASHPDSCKCDSKSMSTTIDTQPTLVSVQSNLHLFTLPALPVTVLNDLEFSIRPLLTAFDTPPPRDAGTLCAQRCLLLI